MAHIIKKNSVCKNVIIVVQVRSVENSAKWKVFEIYSTECMPHNYFMSGKFVV